MAKILKGFLDGFRGLLGNAVGARWRNLDVIKGRPSKSSKAPTPAQLAQQMKFGLATDLVSTLRTQVKRGYQAYNSGNMTAHNAAVQQVLANAITGTYPALKIDYSKVVISEGDLLGVDDVKAVLTGDEITVTWSKNDADTEYRHDTDVAIFILLDPVSKKYLLSDYEKRTALSLTHYVAKFMKGHPLHGWLYMVSADGKSVSNSEYLGQYQVPA